MDIRTHQIDSALSKAIAYLHTVQKSNGSFDNNTISTAWALQALGALDANEADWEKNGQRPSDYLADQQKADGGLDDEAQDLNSRLWSTAYAIPAGLKLPWDSIIKQFSMPANEAPINTNIDLDKLISPVTPETTASSSASSTSETDLKLEKNKTPDLAAGTSTDSLDVKDKGTSASFVLEPTVTLSQTRKNSPSLTKQLIIFRQTAGQVKETKTRATKKGESQKHAESQTRQNNNQGTDKAISPGLPATSNSSGQASDPAKKALYIFGAGTIIAGLVLGLRFIGYVL